MILFAINNNFFILKFIIRLYSILIVINQLNTFLFKFISNMDLTFDFNNKIPNNFMINSFQNKLSYIGLSVY